MSPSKRGILMTPGTAATRRKSVSFGSEALDKKEGAVGCKALTKKRDDTPFAAKSRDVDSDNRSEDESPSKQRSARRGRSVSLTKSLENMRKGKEDDQKKSPKIRSNKYTRRADNASASTVPSPPSNVLPDDEHIPGSYDETEQDFTRVLDFTDKSLGHVTMDLDMPQSESGRYWKSQYKTYHEEALAEMAHVLRYKDLAKSYARKKDSEAADLAHKLQLEQSKVVQMENMITRLSSKHTNLGLEDTGDSLENIKDVAKLRAIVAQYKAQVEEFRIAVEEPYGKREAPRDSLPATRLAGEPTEIITLREELSRARESISAAEKKTKRLEAENVKLAKELKTSDLHLVKQRERNQKIQQSHQDETRRKEEQLAGLRREYDELMDLKRDSEELLRKRQDQVNALKQEIQALKSARPAFPSHGDEVQTFTVGESQADSIASRSRRYSTHEQRATNKEKTSRDRQSLQDVSDPREEATWKRKSYIPFSAQSVPAPAKGLADTESPFFKPDVALQPLSEVINGSSKKKVQGRHLGTAQYSPMATHFSDLSFGDLTSALPSTESFQAQNKNRGFHEKASRISPKPSIVDIPSSPPSFTNPRPVSAGEIVRQNSNPEMRRKTPAGKTSSRLPIVESPRVRKRIPPERAAAAKARLEQKAAEKRKMQLIGS
ncbi:hypothetical protein M7I_7240 [Glarea lozoyensis 74030]|nr:hypothetical protein M7I_7240 [Glarea lozoyensis 74030]